MKHSFSLKLRSAELFSMLETRRVHLVLCVTAFKVYKMLILSSLFEFIENIFHILTLL